MRKYTYKNVGDGVLAIVLEVAKKVVDSIDQGNQYEEQVVERLIADAHVLVARFNPDGTASLRTYLNRYMPQRGKNIVSALNAKSRKMIQGVENLDMYEFGVLDDDFEAFLDRDERAHTCQIVREAIASLDEDSVELAKALMRMKPCDAERFLGWSHGKMMRVKERVEEKLNKNEKIRTWRKECAERCK